DRADRRIARCLEDARRAHCPADGQQRGARRSLCADRSKPWRTEPRDERCVGKGLDVLDKGWQTIDTALKRTWRDDLRFGKMAGDARDQRRLLSCDVAIWTDLYVDEPIAVVTPSPLPDRRAQPRHDVAVRSRRVDDHRASADRLGSVFE